MGAQPKRKLHRKYTRRANKKLTMPELTKCPDTGKWMIAHHVSPHTGKYNGRQVLLVNEA